MFFDMLISMSFKHHLSPLLRSTSPTYFVAYFDCLPNVSIARGYIGTSVRPGVFTKRISSLNIHEVFYKLCRKTVSWLRGFCGSKKKDLPHITQTGRICANRQLLVRKYAGAGV